MTKVYVEKNKLTFTIEDGKIEDIEKGRCGVPDIEVDALDVSTTAIHVSADNRLSLDGFALTDLMAWLWRRMPTASDKSFNDAFMRLFPNSSNITDVVRAVCRVVLDIEHTAPGDAAWFCAKVREAHPQEFAELCKAWKQQFN